MVVMDNISKWVMIRRIQLIRVLDGAFVEYMLFRVSHYYPGYP